MKKNRATFSVVNFAAETTVKNLDSRGVRWFTTSDWVKRVCHKVRLGNAEQKRQLPAVCWAAKFEDNKRHNESASWTGLCYIDIDHVSQFHEQGAGNLYEEKCAGREDELGIVHAQVSPGGDGLHIVFIPETFSSMEQAQADFARKAGIAQYDASCKDLSRMLFLSPLENTLFDALDTLYDD